jgi:catechol 2,3-dioxygenase-like lactoylglutathione lyase family enzyme
MRIFIQFTAIIPQKTVISSDSAITLPLMNRPPIDSQITFLYTRDLTTTADFYERVMRFPLWLDQGSCRIYRVSGDGYLGICRANESRAPDAGRQTNVIFTLVTDRVDEWYDYLTRQGITFEKPPSFNEKYRVYHCFLRDPDGYLIEIQRFESIEGGN